uniref:Endoglucanase n=1 Tax=Limnoria quadripunctata TaxID=161573 RepID=D4HRL2_LIMQU|nr:GH9 family protein [Limnoria quadripunctata]
MKAALGILLLVLGTAYGQGNGGCSGTGMSPYDYSQALCMSPLFYEAQRSGKLPADQRVTWRADSGLQDGADVGLDLTGGYYDAGDYVKFNFPMAASVTALAFGLHAFPSGMSTAGQTNYVKAAVKWGSDYFLKCVQGPTTLWGQVGDPDVDHAYWGRPEDMTETRVSYKIDASAPGTDLAAETAAALAGAAVVHSGSYASECVSAAEQMYTFADEHRGKYSNSIDKAANFYSSYSFHDELPWAALWLYLATGENSYLSDAEGYIQEFGLLDADVLNVDWDDKTAGVYALMVEIDGGSQYTSALQGYVDNLLSYQHTPGGMVYISDWGSLREAVNAAFIAARAASLGIKASSYNNWAQSQADYALGSIGHSYVCGFGNNPPTHPHHGSSSCPVAPQPCGWNEYNSADPNPQTLFGALVGGPDAQDNYVDDRDDYIHNEVACDYNALFTGLLAAMVELH